MKLHAKCLPEYFQMLDLKRSEFRQIESIVLENQVTGETREFQVTDFRKVDDVAQEIVKKRYPMVDWDPELPIYAIDLGDELDRNIMVPDPKHVAELEKRWYAVGD